MIGFAAPEAPTTAWSLYRHATPEQLSRLHPEGRCFQGAVAAGVLPNTPDGLIELRAAHQSGGTPLTNHALAAYLRDWWADELRVERTPQAAYRLRRVRALYAPLAAREELPLLKPLSTARVLAPPPVAAPGPKHSAGEDATRPPAITAGPTPTSDPDPLPQATRIVVLQTRARVIARELAGVVGLVVLSLVVGSQLALMSSTGDREDVPVDSAVVANVEPADSATVEPVTATASGDDWADSIPDPEATWALRGGRAYTPSNKPAAAEPRWGGDRPAGPVSPVLAHRVSGSRVMLYALGDSLPGRGALWSMPGNCQAVLRLDAPAATWSGTAVEARSGADASWLYGLAVPASECAQATQGAVARSLPSRQEALAIVVGVQRSDASTTWRPADLRDVALGRVHGVRYAWGVMRGGMISTRLDSTQTVTSLAFVARETGKQWEVVWQERNQTEGGLLALAGVYDTDGLPDAVPEAIFARRMGGLQELIIVGAGGDGSWATRTVRSF
jgi:hypothetical protein